MKPRLDPAIERALRAVFRTYEPDEAIDPDDGVDEFARRFAQELEREAPREAR